MSISEQLKELRDCVKKWQNFENVSSSEPFKFLSEASDTIEALSAKLEDMERSAEDCGGGWIYCGDGNNLPEIERDIILSTRSLDVYKGYRANTEGYFYAEGEGYILYENVLAWMPQPEPYQGAKRIERIGENDRRTEMYC